MCGIVGLFGEKIDRSSLIQGIGSLRHRGPDGEGMFINPSENIGLAHRRLSIIDLTENAGQPMTDSSGRFTIVFNGEVYNYRELRGQLSDYPFRTNSDTEVVLAAFEKWGIASLEKFIGMFAFLIWDEREQQLLAVRDRFGVKPLYRCTLPDGTIAFASEIKALFAVGMPREKNVETWATYLAYGAYDHGRETFWKGIESVQPGTVLSFYKHEVSKNIWYDLFEKVGDDIDTRAEQEVADEYLSLLKSSVDLRFRSDVPVGINISGGLDSSILYSIVRDRRENPGSVECFTFITGDPAYDELPWVEKLLEGGGASLNVIRLHAKEIPELAESVQSFQDEPFGGFPTLAYAKIFEAASQSGIKVLLDGQGIDEQWAGYDYYLNIQESDDAPLVQGTKSERQLGSMLSAEMSEKAVRPSFPKPFKESLRNLQYRDACFTKIPRALRFNDRISMRASTELREPFLDHRLFELALRQPRERKVADGITKVLPRKLATKMIPANVSQTPKRPVQTPQREWLRGELSHWADAKIDYAVNSNSDWFDAGVVSEKWNHFKVGDGDNSFPFWQIINLGLITS
jgi:asparagine synthase (glutamine-hydrolysing)